MSTHDDQIKYALWTQSEKMILFRIFAISTPDIDFPKYALIEINL